MSTFELFGHTITMRLADEEPESASNTTAVQPSSKKESSDSADALLIPLFERYSRWLRALAMAMGCKLHDAEDLVQDTYLLARSKLHQLRDPDRVVGWVKTIIVNRAKNVLSRKKMEFFSDLDYNRSSEGDTCSTCLAIHEDDVAAPVMNREIREVFQSVLPELSPFSQEAIADFYFEGNTIAQIAALRKLPIGTVKRRLFEARHQLRNALQKKGYTAQDFV